MIAALLAAAAQAGTLVVAVENVRNDRGVIHIDVCDEQTFLKLKCPVSKEVPAHIGVTTLTVPDLPPGRYAVQATHDENNNKKVDRALFGIPKEGVGFSRDARITFGPPKWADASFDFADGAPRVAFRLRYFLGPSGPPAK